MGERNLGDEATLQQVIRLGERVLTTTTTDVEPDVSRLIALRLDCYLRPHAERIFADAESALGVILPDRLEVTLSGSPKSVRASASEWHLYLPHGDRDSVRTLERVLVQLAARATGWTPGNGDVGKLHAAVCPLIEREVDITFVCVLELL